MGDWDWEGNRVREVKRLNFVNCYVTVIHRAYLIQPGWPQTPKSETQAQDFYVTKNNTRSIFVLLHFQPRDNLNYLCTTVPRPTHTPTTHNSMPQPHASMDAPQPGLLLVTSTLFLICVLLTMLNQAVWRSLNAFPDTIRPSPYGGPPANNLPRQQRFALYESVRRQKLRVA